MNTTSRRRTAAALKVTGWAITFLAVLLNADFSAKDSVDRPAAEMGAEGLAEANECSSAVQNPTHVIVTTKDGVTRYAGQAMTDKAIEQAMFGMDHGLTIHAFCP